MVDKLGDLNAILVNSVFPHILANVCEKLNINLIHPTTDCVYIGNKGNYTEKDEHDIQDVYGRTKSLGEPKNCMVIRTSIIGEETDNKRSLVEWVKSQKNKEINGFNNHLWNGITCLEWVKFVSYIIETNSFWIGTKHIFSPNIVNKYELLNLINKIYNLNIIVKEISANETIDRTLNSIYSFNYEIPNLKIQIEEMKNFEI
jgi:dTDP-4-dehydrorhamnose reductase